MDRGEHRLKKNDSIFLRTPAVDAILGLDFVAYEGFLSFADLVI